MYACPRRLEHHFLPPIGSSKCTKNDMSCLMDYHIFQKSHRSNHDGRFSHSVDEKMDFGLGPTCLLLWNFWKMKGGGVLRIMEIQQNQGKSIKCMGKWTLARLGPVQNALKFVGVLRICTKTTQKTKNIRKSASGKFQNPKNPLKSNGLSNSISVIFP